MEQAKARKALRSPANSQSGKSARTSTSYFGIGGKFARTLPNPGRGEGSPHARVSGVRRLRRNWPNPQRRVMKFMKRALRQAPPPEGISNGSRKSVDGVR